MSIFNIIPIVIILVSLSIVIVIVVRKFSVLANLDVKNIPAEKEAKFKQKILSDRLKRKILKWNFKVAKHLGPIASVARNSLRLLYQKLYELKDYHASSANLDVEAGKTIEQLFSEAEELSEKEDYDGAEKNYIEIIGREPKNVFAFKKLADLYYKNKNFNEAKQSYEHILRLYSDKMDIKDYIETEGNETEFGHEYADISFDLAEVSNKIDNLEDAKKYLSSALSVEPNNPRFLDFGVNLSIINKDKVKAIEYYDRLLKSNPKNQKLKEFKELIGRL